MAPHKLNVIPCFADAMLIAGATNLTLSAAAGVDPKTIQRARNGVGVRPFSANLLMQTLCIRSFVRLKPGRK
jgi:hypothetical protein